MITKTIFVYRLLLLISSIAPVAALFCKREPLIVQRHLRESFLEAQFAREVLGAVE